MTDSISREAAKPRRNCTDCENRIKAATYLDENGGDFWHCTAEPILPAFVDGLRRGQSPARAWLINLKLFDFVDATTHAHLITRDCKLHTLRVFAASREQIPSPEQLK